MTEVQNFRFGQAELRVVQLAGDPWFVAKDVADVLDFNHVPSMLRGLDDDEKGVHKMHTLGGIQDLSIINESGLYSLVLRSNKPEAKVFKKWVTSEVLPAIRKHGGYLTAERTQQLIDNPDLIIEMAQNLKREREKRREAELLAQRNEEIIALQDKVLVEVQPKVQYYESVLAAEDAILTNIIAKELGMSGGTLNKKLRDKKVIYNQHGTWLLYAKYQNQGLAKTRTYTYTGSDGQKHTNIQLVWTQKGREFIHNLFK